MRPLGSVGQQRAVGVVDVEEHLPADAEPGEGRHRAVIAGHRHVAHALAGLRAEPGLDHLVVAEEGAVEEHQRRA